MGNAPFTWEYFADKFNMEFMGGHMSPCMDLEAKQVRFGVGWAIRDKDVKRADTRY